MYFSQLNPLAMLTEEQYVALAREEYKHIEALKELDSLYDHEKAFEAVWLELGQQVLQQTISQPPNDRRKKKRS